MTTKSTAKSASTATGWRNRIVGHGEEAPDQLLANPKNWRVHPEAQSDALEGALKGVGWVQDVVVNQRSGHLVDGHLRVSLALRRNEPSVPVVYVDLDEREEAIILAALDPLSAMAVADKEQLDLLLRDVQISDAGLTAMFADLAEEEGLYFEGEQGAEVEDVSPGGDGGEGTEIELILRGKAEDFSAFVVDEIHKIAQRAGITVVNDDPSRPKRRYWGSWKKGEVQKPE